MVEVEHVKAHRTKKEKKEMSHFEKFVTEGNEKADALAKAGAMLHKGFMTEARTETVQQEREYAALQCAASFHCLVKRNGKIVKNSSQNQKKSGSLVVSVANKAYSVWLHLRMSTEVSSVPLQRSARSESLRLAEAPRTSHSQGWRSCRAGNGTPVRFSHRCRTELVLEQVPGLLQCSPPLNPRSATMHN